MDDSCNDFIGVISNKGGSEDASLLSCSKSENFGAVPGNTIWHVSMKTLASQVTRSQHYAFESLKRKYRYLLEEEQQSVGFGYNKPSRLAELREGSASYSYYLPKKFLGHCVLYEN
jgi:hypothetical protein